MPDISQLKTSQALNNTILIVVSGILLSLSCQGQENLADQLKKPIAELPSVHPGQVGMQQDTIQKLIQLINTTPPNDFRGLVVIKENKLVVEEYFNTYWRATIHDIRSAGKSITALLLGIAIDQGLIKDVEQSIYNFFPAPEFSSPPGNEYANIKIKHLLTMSSGLDADDMNPNSPGRTSNWIAEDEWVNFALQLPMSFPSGEKWVYNDVCAMLTGAIIERVAGKKLSDFAKENLFLPLGIQEFYWFTGANGITGAMGNLYLSTLDFAKIGLLIVNEGSWQGQQIISPTWIHAISQKRLDISEIDPFADAYGYLWYIAEKEVDNKKYEYIYASGNGGNLLFVVPDEKLVIGLTSSAYGQGYGHQRSHNIFEYVLKSIVQD